MGDDMPSTPAKFDQIMEEIDQQLCSSGTKISLRPLIALGIVAERFGLSLPIPAPSLHAPAGLRENWLTSEHVRAWYDHRYGEKLKMHMGPGSMAFLIRSEVWVFDFPAMFGKTQLFASTTVPSRQSNSSRKPAQYNVLDAGSVLKLQDK